MTESLGKSWSFVFAIIAAVAFAGICNGDAFLATDQRGRVEGLVLDPNGAAIQHARVVFTNGKDTWRVTTNDSGEYEAELPTGTYEVTTEITEYYPLKRSSFLIKSEAVIRMNLAPALRILAVRLRVTPSGSEEPITTAPMPMYDSFLLPRVVGTPRDLLIRYRDRIRRKSLIEYTSVMITHDAFSLFADRVSFDANTFLLTARGNVIIQNGQQEIRAANAAVSFKNGRPLIRVIGK